MLNVACKWVAIGVLLFVFFGLLSVAGNVHVAEFYGAIFFGIIAGGAFYLMVCRKRSAARKAQE